MILMQSEGYVEVIFVVGKWSRQKPLSVIKCHGCLCPAAGKPSAGFGLLEFRTPLHIAKVSQGWHDSWYQLDHSYAWESYFS